MANVFPSLHVAHPYATLVSVSMDIAASNMKAENPEPDPEWVLKSGRRGFNSSVPLRLLRTCMQMDRMLLWDFGNMCPETGQMLSLVGMCEASPEGALSLLLFSW